MRCCGGRRNESGPGDTEAALIRDRLEALQHCLRRMPADSVVQERRCRLIGPIFAWATIMCGALSGLRFGAYGMTDGHGQNHLACLIQYFNYQI